MKREIKTEILVVGAGFAGLSTAYHLRKSGVKHLVVIEQEKKLGGHSSGRNAGMIRQAISDPALAAVAAEGRRSLEQAEKNGWDLGLRASGSLFLAQNGMISELGCIRKVCLENAVHCQPWTREEAARRVSVLGGGNFKAALFCPSDVVVDIDRLMKAFLRALKTLGVSVRLGMPVSSVECPAQGGFRVRCAGQTVLCEKMVNAAGAWAGALGERAGALTIPFKAYRRHLYEVSGWPAKKTWPFVWDLSHEFYFRPVGGRLMLSPCDKRPFQLALGKKSPAKKTDPSMRGELRRKLAAFSSSLPSYRILNEKAGLRTMTPDGRFVIGEDPVARGFFWAAGLGGHGVTTCFSSGRLVAEAVLGKSKSNKITKAFSPKRFQ